MTISKKRSSNPIAEKDVAETFAESDVTTSLTNCIVNSESIELGGSGVFVDDWEDGDIQGWTGDTGNLSNQQSTVLSDSWTGELFSSNGFPEVTSPSVGGIQDDLGFRIRMSVQTTDGSEGVTLNLYDSGGTHVLKVEFRDDVGDIFVGGIDVGNWAANTTYEMRLVFDFPNDTVDVYLDSNLVGSDIGFSNSASDWDYLLWKNNNASTGTDRSAYLDNISEYTSGTAYIEWPEPADVFRWDAATFQRTLDSETVQIDVQEDDGSGWTTIATNIQRGQDITADPGSRVRFVVTLERSDTANNPRLKSIARRWVI